MKRFIVLLMTLVLLNGCCDPVTYPDEDLSSLDTHEPVAPITDLIGKTFYTLDLTTANDGYAIYKKITFKHLDAPDGIKASEYIIHYGDSNWTSWGSWDFEYMDSYDFTSSEIQGDKLHIISDEDQASMNIFCPEASDRNIKEIFIIEKSDDVWTLEIAFVGNGDSYVDTMKLEINKPLEVENPSLIDLKDCKDCY